VVVDRLLDDLIQRANNFSVLVEFQNLAEFFWHFLYLEVDAPGVGIGDQVVLVVQFFLLFLKPGDLFLDVGEQVLAGVVVGLREFDLLLGLLPLDDHSAQAQVAHLPQPVDVLLVADVAPQLIGVGLGHPVELSLRLGFMQQCVGEQFAG